MSISFTLILIFSKSLQNLQVDVNEIYNKWSYVLNFLFGRDVCPKMWKTLWRNFSMTWQLFSIDICGNFCSIKQRLLNNSILILQHLICTVLHITFLANTSIIWRAVRPLDLRLQNKFRLLLIITFICCLSDTFVYVFTLANLHSH